MLASGPLHEFVIVTHLAHQWNSTYLAAPVSFKRLLDRARFGGFHVSLSFRLFNAQSRRYRLMSV